MKHRVCQECGLENEENADYCMECGSKLHPMNIQDDNRKNHLLRFLSKYSKTLIFIVAMIALLGVTIEFLGFMNEYNEAKDPYLSNFNQSNETIQKAGWHQVTNYTGIGNSSHAFTIKGEKFKVVINATPTRNYDTNFMDVDVKGASTILGSGKLNWGARSAVKSKEKTINITAPPGKYNINVHTKDLKKWKVTVYDYY